MGPLSGEDVSRAFPLKKDCNHRERQKSKDREAEWEQLREAALRNRGDIQTLPDTITKAAPARILSPFDEQAEQQELASGGMIGMDSTMQSFSNSMSGQFDSDAGDEVVPSTDDLEDTHGEMVGFEVRSAALLSVTRS